MATAVAPPISASPRTAATTRPRVAVPARKNPSDMSSSDDCHAPNDRVRAEPGNQHEARCEGPDNAAQRARGRNAAHRAARAGEIAERELGDDRRDRAQDHRGDEEHGRNQCDDPQHHRPRIGQGCAKRVDQQHADARQAGEQEKQAQQAGRGSPVRQLAPQVVAQADAGKDDADDAGPGVERNADVGRDDATGHQFQHHDARAGDEDDQRWRPQARRPWLNVSFHEPSLC